MTQPRRPISRKTWCCAVLCASFLVTTAAPSHGAPITFGDLLWYEFSFAGVGSIASGGVGSIPSSAGNSQFAPDGPWTFTVPVDAELTVTDAFLSGDRFEVFDFGASLGPTSLVSTGENCDSDPDLCVANTLMSTGVFGLPAGDHSISIVAIASPFGQGAGYFRTDAVAAAPIPEPTTLALLITGLAAIIVRSRHARR